MKHKGFGETWLNWMQLILSSRTLSILLNGTLGKVFHYRRDVRQSDPMSPLLFILTVDLLQSVINKECSQGHKI